MQINRLEVEEGFLDGLDLPFASGPNVLIGSRGTGKRSIIELMRWALGVPALTVVDEFDAFVRPVVEPKLSQFCTALATIKRADVDGADMFAAVFARFLDWVGAGPYRLCSWGFFDVGQFRLDCTRFGVMFPEQFESDHLNIKQVFADREGVRRCGMTAALDLLGLPLAGTHHRGIDDARNIARIVQMTLPNVVAG